MSAGRGARPAESWSDVGVLDERIRRRQRLRNGVQSALLLGGLVLVAAGLAWLLFGTIGLLWILLAGVVVAAVRPRVPTRSMLAMYGAQELPPAAAPELHHLVQALARRAELSSPPTLYYVPSRVPNAFAVGRGGEAGLAVTDGILRTLTGRQLAGVLAHEVSHIRSGDTTVMALSDAISRLTQMLAYLGMFSILLTVPLTIEGHPRLLVLSAGLIALPFLVTLLQLALARNREYDADLAGAALTGDPAGLAAALAVLERSAGRLWERTMVSHGRLPDPILLRTHPATDERIRRLRARTPREQRWLGPEHPLPPRAHPPVAGRPRLRFPGIRW
jgi:heat shock protein HtpX